MKKTKFENLILYYSIIILLICLILFNFYSTFQTQNYIGFLPILLQLTLLILIINKHKFAKVGIKLWAILLIIVFGLKIVGKLLKDSADDTLSSNLEKYIILIIGFTIGIILLNLTNTTVKVIDTE